METKELKNMTIGELMEASKKSNKMATELLDEIATLIEKRIKHDNTDADGNIDQCGIPVALAASIKALAAASAQVVAIAPDVFVEEFFKFFQIVFNKNSDTSKLDLSQKSVRVGDGEKFAAGIDDAKLAELLAQKHKGPVD